MVFWIRTVALQCGLILLFREHTTMFIAEKYQTAVCLVTFWLLLSPFQPQSSRSFQTLGLECIIAARCLQSNYSLIWLVAPQDDKRAGCQAGSEVSHYPTDCRQWPHQDSLEGSSWLWDWSAAVCVSPDDFLDENMDCFQDATSQQAVWLLVFLSKAWQPFWSERGYFIVFSIYISRGICI